METQNTFMLEQTTHALQTFSSSAVTFATADNSIAATDIGTATFSAGEKITVSGAAQAGNNATFTILTVASGKLVVTETVTAESAGNAVVINEEYYGAWKDIRAFSQITGMIRVSQACTLYIDQSPDAITADYTETASLSAATTNAIQFNVVGTYGRFRIKNGGTDQTYLRATVNGRTIT
jgi:hypothetical protein